MLKKMLSLFISLAELDAIQALKLLEEFTRIMHKVVGIIIIRRKKNIVR